MDARDMLREQFRFAHQLMEITIEDVPPETAAAKLDGTINNIATVYAHAIVAEDAFVSGATEGGVPVLEAGGWGEKTGIPNVTTRQDEDWGDLSINLDETRKYAAAVYEATDAFLASAPDDTIFRESDGPGGKIRLIPQIGLLHLAQHWGEIAALKGVQGMKGIPF